MAVVSSSLTRTCVEDGMNPDENCNDQDQAPRPVPDFEDHISGERPFRFSSLEPRRLTDWVS